ncbi:carboxypeptidase-like regulatory domain-containing protein [Patescibacteria group bacterium]
MENNDSRFNSLRMMGVVLATTPFLVELSSIGDIPILIRDVFARLFGVFFSRKRKRKWGVVYDIKSGKPVPMATVSILNERGLLKEKKITDKYGSYFFLVPSNEYFIKAKKKGYEQLGTSVSDSPISGKQENLGKHVEIFDEASVIRENIPFKKKKLSIINILVNHSLFNGMVAIIFWIGFISSFAIAVVFPNILNAVIIFVYFVVLAIRAFAVGNVEYGVVRDSLGKNLAFATIKAMNQETGEVVSRIVADEKGRYFMILDEGSYVIEAKDLHGNLSVRKSLKLKRRDALDVPLVLS